MIFNGLGYKIYLVFLLALTILLIQKGDFFYYSKNLQNQKIWTILIITFHPIFAFNFIIQWEDKLQLLIIPLLMIILIDKKKFYLASFCLGFSIAFNGILTFFLIPYLFYLYDTRKKMLFINLIIVLVSITLTLVPFFPDSIIGWVNRANRVNGGDLFWYSIYLLLPENFYSPQLNQITIILIMLIFYVMFLAKKIILRDLIIVSVCLTLVFGPYNSIERILPVILLIAIFTSAVVRLYWITLSLLLFIYSFLSVNFEFSKNIHFTHVLLFYLPFFWVIGMYIHSRLTIKLDNPERQLT